MTCCSHLSNDGEIDKMEEDSVVFGNNSDSCGYGSRYPREHPTLPPHARFHIKFNEFFVCTLDVSPLATKNFYPYIADPNGMNAWDGDQIKFVQPTPLQSAVSSATYS